MKKAFFLCVLGILFLISAMACNHSVAPAAPGVQGAIKAMNLPQSLTPTFTAGPQTACFTSAGHGAAYIHAYGNCGFPPGPPDPVVISVVPIPCLFYCDNSPTGNCGACVPQDRNPDGSVIVPAGTYTFTGPFTVPNDPPQVTIGLQGGAGNVFINGQPFTGGFTFDFNLNQVVGNPSSPMRLTRGANQFTFVVNYDGSQFSCLTISWNICESWFGQPLPPTPTPTSTPTGTLTPPTNTPTGTLSPTISPTPTGTLTPSVSPTVSGTVSASPTVLETVSSTTTGTTTPDTPTNSPTATDTPTSTFTFTPTPTPTCPGMGYNPAFTPYKQSNSNWAATKMPIGNTTLGPNHLSSGNLDPHTIKSDGCLMTCLAMISPGNNPATADTILSDSSNTTNPNGDITTTGDLDYVNGATDLGLTVDASYPANTSKIPQALGESDFVIARVPHGGRNHYVLITGVAVNPVTHNCDFTISDPGSASATFLSQYGGANLLMEVNMP